MNGRSFTLKYQLPSEDLDSLISVTTDEDLDNMIEEYDRNQSSQKQSRLRLFLFPVKIESTQSMIGPILESTVKSDDWFLNALNNGSGGALNRGFSDSASVNCLLGLDDDINGGFKNNNVELGVRDVDLGLQKKINQDIQSVPDSPMLETNSSFGSTSSSPSLANLPPIRVRGDESNRMMLQQEQKMVAERGLEEQFAAQMNFIGGGGATGGLGLKPQPPYQQQGEDGNFLFSAPPPMPMTIVMPVSAGGGYADRVISDDERSDHGVPVGYRKPPAPIQAPPQSQPQQKTSGGSGNGDLPSPDSVSSDDSLSNPLSRQKPLIYQDPSRVAASNLVEQMVNVSDQNTRVHFQQPIQDSGYILQNQSQPQFDLQQQAPQQQYIHAGGAHYILHQPSGTVPVPSYYPLYPPQQQTQHHQQQQFPTVYYMPARQQPQQAYNLPVQQQSGNTEPVGNCGQTPLNPNVLPSAAAYNPMRNAKPEMAAPPPGMYRTAAGGAPPQLVQLPTTQHQQQYMGYSQQIHHQSQSVAPGSAAPGNYTYEFSDPAHAQIYYTQPLAPTMPSQYQTMTTGAGVMLPEASAQFSDNSKQRST
jgi:hypothetical protein